MRAVKIFLGEKMLCTAKDRDAGIRRHGNDMRIVSQVRMQQRLFLKRKFEPASEWPQCSKNRIDNVLAPAIEFCRCGEIALENGGEREAVRKIKETQ